MTFWRTLCASQTPLKILLVAMLVALSGCTRESTDFAKHVVVKVNEKTLTAQEFSELLASRLKMFNALSAKDSAVISQSKNAIVQDFIVQVVTEDWAHKNQLFVRREQLDSEITKVRSQYPDEIAFRKALADEGLVYDTWVNRLKYNILEKLVVNELRKTITAPSSDDLKSFYSNNKNLFQITAAIKLRQIVLRTETDAQKIKKELSSGKPMADLAKKYSITPEGAQGGDTGWIEKGTLDVFDSGFRLGLGQRSSILKSSYGYHIYEVTAKRAAKTLSFDESRKDVEKAFLAQREQEVYSSWLENQILKARVFKDDAFISKIQVHTRSLQ